MHGLISQIILWYARFKFSIWTAELAHSGSKKRSTLFMTDLCVLFTLRQTVLAVIMNLVFLSILSAFVVDTASKLQVGCIADALEYVF